MKLYHGTTGKYLKSILSEGIKPRGKREGNWVDNLAGRKDCVYLTQAYGTYYAMNAMSQTARGDQWNSLIILEIVLSDLDYIRHVYPDEEFIWQVHCHSNRRIDKGKGYEFYARNVRRWKGSWGASIKEMGTCSFMGRIKPSCITRHVEIDMNIKSARRLVLCQNDPAVGIMNHRFCSDFYMQFNSWLLGDIEKVESQIMHPAAKSLYETRAGITVKART